MSVYLMTSEDLSEFVDCCIRKSGAEEKLILHKAEIMAALTNDFNIEEEEKITEVITLWKNKIEQPSKLIIGRSVIHIQEIVLSFIEVFFSSGMAEALIDGCSSEERLPEAGVKMAAGIVTTMWNLFESATKLDGADFCMYKIIAEHYREQKNFCLEDVISWMPQKGHMCCLINKKKIECEFMDGNYCLIFDDKSIEKTLISLYNKNLLYCEKKGGKENYKCKL